ncbi:hypothetical protein [Natrinema sp. SYSU A 869]|uniref:hypothetical protein n=1 Tax=Natrinema sp. SYSU A 869 TaxID=2871694 RepID=UPI001CA3C705|nr:hypothetical protein [Natrinema sp. SYSU A 869]
MSSDRSGEDESEETFEDQLESMYERYRRQHLEDELEALAMTMEETLLQQAIAETFFEESIEIESDVKAAVEATVEKLEAGKYDTVEAELDELSKQVDRAETRITNRIQQLRIDRQDTATAMRRLNERVQRIDGSQLQALETLLDDWNWKEEVFVESNETYADRRKTAAQYGEDMRVVFETLKEQLFGVYEDTELRPLVDDLLDDDRLRLGDLTLAERRQLADSDLANYIELKLS